MQKVRMPLPNKAWIRPHVRWIVAIASLVVCRRESYEASLELVSLELLYL